MTHVIANKQNGDLRTWQVVNNELTGVQTFSVGTSNNTSLALTRDGLWLFSGWGSGTTNANQIFRRSNDEGTLGSEEQIAGTPDASIRDLALSPDGDWLAVCHVDDGSGDYSGNSLSIFAVDGGDLTRITSISLPSVARGVGWNDRSDRLIVSRDNTGTVHLYGWDGEALSLLDSLSISTGQDPPANVQWMEGDLVAVEASTTTTKLLTAEADTLVKLDDAIGLSGGEMARYRHLLADAGSSDGDLFIWDTSEGEFVEVDNIEAEARGVAMHESGSLLAGVDHDGANYGINLITFDGETLTVVDTATWDTVIGNVLIYPYWAPDVAEPLTPEEEFAATYADASGRDPLPTMLVDGPSCQRAINTYARFWASVGDPLVVPVFVGLGKLSLVEQGQVIKVQSTRHAIGLETGRAALVMRPRIDPRSGTCELTVQPNKEDLES